jgi:deazaflavin-dependent oxidoreductase (nitroreductase family)
MTFWIVRHVGRRTGTVYETPIMLAPVDGGFIAELTYGDQVQWYQNVVAAGGCTIVRGGREWQVAGIEPYGTKEGRAAFGGFARVVLTLLRRKEFRFLRAA